ncbi:MAG: sigma-70 family RNA polymerase sigma factor [Bacteroidetes bacterium]|nr:sigma-70 family RNA polymerase sigma factor [Bacteroidota bacterium]
MDYTKILEGCLKGNLKAQRELYECFAGKMLGVCMRYSSNREEAKDMLHDGFIKVFTKLDSFSGTGPLEAWIRRIMVNTALEQLRKNDVLRDTTDYDGATDHIEANVDIISDITRNELMQIIAGMPPGYRTVFNLFAIEGYSHQEISELLQISEGTSKSQYSRAKSWLQSKITVKYKVQ